MPMYEGNWKCSGCAGPITQLPFQPRNESGLTCRTCYAKSKDDSATAAPAPGVTTASELPDIPADAGLVSAPPDDDPFAGMEGLQDSTPAEKPAFAGSWSCASCNGSITSLPFTPRRTDNLKCLDCFKASK